MRRCIESGEIRIGAIIWLVVLAVVGLILWEAVPVKVRSSRLQDFMVEQARFYQARGARVSEERIKRNIVEKARELRLPVEPENVTVERLGGMLVMRAVYTVPLEFPLYTYMWDFDTEVERPVFDI